jgi:hypothetical protein
MSIFDPPEPPYIKGEKVVQIDTTDPFVGATAVKMGAQFLFALMVSEIEERATTSRPSGEWN